MAKAKISDAKSNTAQNNPKKKEALNSHDDFIHQLMYRVRGSQPIILVRTDNVSETAEQIHAFRSIISPKIKKLYLHTPTSRWVDLKDLKESSVIQQVLEQAEKMREAANADARKKLMPSFVHAEATEAGAIREIFRPIKKLIGDDYTLGDRVLFMLSLESVKMKENSAMVLQAMRDFDAAVRSAHINGNLIILAHKSFTFHQDFGDLFTEIEYNTPNKDECTNLFKTLFVDDVLNQSHQETVADPVSGKEKSQTVLDFGVKYLGDYQEVISRFTGLQEFCVNTLSGLPERTIELEFRAAFMACLKRNADGMISEFDETEFKNHIYKIKFKEMNKLGTLELLHSANYTEVGGFQPLKDWLKQQAWAMTPEARNMGVDMPKGCALVGPPGTGKTLIAQTASAIFSYPCVKFNVDAVFNKFVGESESRLAETLSAIEAMAPCILFVDEVDKVFGSANGGAGLDGGVSSRVFGRLLSWMQDTDKPIFTIVTANRPLNIPAEFLRKGRLDEIWFVAYPTAHEREEALRIHLKRRNRHIDDLSSVIAITQNYSGAELEYIVKSSVTESAYGKLELSPEILAATARRVIPSSVQFQDNVREMMSWARTNARMASAELPDTISGNRHQLSEV